MTERESATHKAIVKETEGGVPHIYFELLEGTETGNLQNFNVGFNLSSDTTYEQAEEIAKVINTKITGLYLI